MQFDVNSPESSVDLVGLCPANSRPSLTDELNLPAALGNVFERLAAQGRPRPLLLGVVGPAAIALHGQLDGAVAHPCGDDGERDAADEVLHREVVAKVSHRNAWNTREFAQSLPDVSSSPLALSLVQSDVREPTVIWNDQVRRLWLRAFVQSLQKLAAAQAEGNKSEFLVLRHPSSPPDDAGALLLFDPNGALILADPHGPVDRGPGEVKQ